MRFEKTPLKKTPSWLYFAFSFLVLLIIGLFMRDGWPLPRLMASVDHLVDGLVGWNDPRSFGTAAKDIAAHGQLSGDNAWIFHLWPPGFIFLEAGILKVFGADVPIIFVLEFFCCAFLGVMLLLQRDFLRPLIGRVASEVAPFILFLFPVARIFLVEPAGVILGEAFSVASFLSGVLLVLRAIQAERLAWAVLAGLFLAVAAYFRSQYESLMLAATAVAVPLVLWQAVKIVRGAAQTKHQATVIVRSLLVALMVAHVLMLPWRIRNYHDRGGMGWVQTMDIVIQNALSSNEILLAGDGEFVIAGGGNLACRLEPGYCGKTEKSLFFKAFLHHMPEWYGIKLSLVPDYWMASPRNMSLIRYPASLVERIVNLVLMACVVMIVPLLGATRKHPVWPILLWANLSFFGGFFVIFSLVQFEVRYFYLIKIYGLVMCIMLASIAWSQFSLRKRLAGAVSVGEECYSESERSSRT
ncbi:hypothetical protein D7S89_07270 [Trinickia fusca]|uniref:Glycosyltransferase RgtA/B/C/D-like domain-containing protein n=2 Tax=Trinickia fusca TaxID=2419777 RepID=A0A494XRV6_9BURK|nr:hypothetical protein D7S89_07270 [Trinickia fusca]